MQLLSLHLKEEEQFRLLSYLEKHFGHVFALRIGVGKGRFEEWLITEEDYLDEIKDYQGRVVVLTEKDHYQGPHPALFKYQRVDWLVRDLLALMGEEGKKKVFWVSNGRTQVLKLLTKRGRVLYWNASPFAEGASLDLPVFLPEDLSGKLSVWKKQREDYEYLPSFQMSVSLWNEYARVWGQVWSALQKEEADYLVLDLPLELAPFFPNLDCDYLVCQPSYEKIIQSYFREVKGREPEVFREGESHEI